ncbi:hypothetical protein AVEN_213220-1 [Araneus ventricosus]|uniref:Uncharacterized protein n=1 Tax=Araneus ventricosus TaxID=182803 RepID=A0A4Y2FTN1_ARAVE|nr:hypothetical protein AVEN_213220-1 [Araneus ventricosus]
MNSGQELTASNHHLEVRHTTAVGRFVQLQDELPRNNSSATPLVSDGRCLKREEKRRRRADRERGDGNKQTANSVVLFFEIRNLDETGVFLTP